MNTDRLQQILGENKSRTSVDSDINLKIQLDGKQQLLPINDLNYEIDTGVQFNKERQGSSYYRLIGTINPLISNALFNMSGPNSWDYLNNILFFADEVNYADSIKRNLKEVDGWFGYYDPIKSASTLCNYIDMEPKRQRFSFIPDVTNQNVKNWELTITYPYTADTTHNMINGGLLLIDTTPVTIGGRDMVALTTPVKHNLSLGGKVIITGTSIDGEYTVVRLGLDNGDLKEYAFCIDVNFTSVSIGQSSRIIRLVNGQPSKYYFRKFKKIKTKNTPVIETDDYEVYKLAFSDNIYRDDITQFVFNEDIDVSNLTDNLNRPLSELYLTIVKTDSNNIFTNVSSGIETPLVSNINSSSVLSYLLNVPAIQKIHNGGSSPFQSHVPLEGSVNINNNDFYGDVVEYNAFEVKETVLADVSHRFNTINREGNGTALAMGPRHEGYYYKAHQLIKIREFSSYIEQGDKTTGGLPDYYQDLGDGRYLWRDLLDIGADDISNPVLNYPFTNGCHYLHSNYIFEVKRQDPFDNWDLFYSSFPSDPIGNAMDNKFKVNMSNNVC